jgi:hypothetical protein
MVAASRKRRLPRGRRRRSALHRPSAGRARGGDQAAGAGEYAKRVQGFCNRCPRSTGSSSTCSLFMRSQRCSLPRSCQRGFPRSACSVASTSAPPMARSSSIGRRTDRSSASRPQAHLGQGQRQTQRMSRRARAERAAKVAAKSLKHQLHKERVGRRDTRADSATARRGLHLDLRVPRCSRQRCPTAPDSDRPRRETDARVWVRRGLHALFTDHGLAAPSVRQVRSVHWQAHRARRPQQPPRHGELVQRAGLLASG